MTSTAPLGKLVQSQEESFLGVRRPIRRSSVFRGIKPTCFLLIVVGLLFLNIESCTAKRHARSRPRAPSDYKSQDEANAEGGNTINEYSDGYDNNDSPSNPENQEDLTGVVVDQTDTEIETIRFGKPAKTSHSTKHGHGTHNKKQTSVSSDSKRGNDDGDYLEREPLQNNDLQKIGLSTRALKSLAEKVADAILAKADELYESLKGGNGARAVTDGQGKVSDSDVGNYVICDDTIRKI